MAEEGVGAETGCAVGCLTGCGGDEALEEAAETAFAGYYWDGVEETFHSWVGGFAVVDSVEGSIRLYSLCPCCPSGMEERRGGLTR